MDFILIFLIIQVLSLPIAIWGWINAEKEEEKPNFF